MTIYYQDDHVTLHHADCIEAMRAMPDNSVHAIVTDPPYGLGFMGKKWDDLPPGLDFAVEALRVLKPGGHLLAFGGTRTWHRLAVAVEDAGFELRDSIAWLYGSGFPKSMDVAKAIDKGYGATRDRQLEFTAWMRSTGVTSAQINEATGTNMGGHYLTAASQPAIATADLFDLLRPLLPDVPERIERLVAERTGIEWTDYIKRPTIGQRDVPVGHAFAGSTYGGDSASRAVSITAPATPDAERWQGWGTALKPAFEPIVMARKPFPRTVAANVLEHGTGGLNIDACRIGTTVETWPSSRRYGGGRGDSPEASAVAFGRDSHGARTQETGAAPSGRWPANVILDEHMAGVLDEQSGVLKTGGEKAGGERGGTFRWKSQEFKKHDDGGGASRFFYVAKAPKRERPDVGGIKHPTVKPLKLMRLLIRLVTPPGGVILEPFAGSGATVEAALLEGFDVIAIEREAEYLPLIQARIRRTPEATDDTNEQDAFDLEGLAS